MFLVRIWIRMGYFCEDMDKAGGYLRPETAPQSIKIGIIEPGYRIASKAPLLDLFFVDFITDG